MLTALLISTLTCPLTIPQTPAAVTPGEAVSDAVVADQDVDEWEEKIRAAGDDVEKLLALAEECTGASNLPARNRVLQRVLEVDRDNQDALWGLQWQEKFGAAGDDVEKLLALSEECAEALQRAAWNRVLLRVLEVDEDNKDALRGVESERLLVKADACIEAKDRAGAKAIWQQLIEIDTDNPWARKGLRHQRYADQWFESYVALSKYKREEAKRKEAEGLALHEGEWVPKDDLPYIKLGWEKGAGGWVNPVEVARAKEIARLKNAGYQYRADDNSWVAKEDVGKWSETLFKCGEEWLPLEEADKYHATYETMWQIAGERYVVLTTREWATGNWARWHADQTYPELVRIFGVEPAGKPEVAVLRNLREYNETAGTRANFSESEGFSSIHGAYFSDSSFDASTAPPQYRGCGVTYWDTESEIGAWGPMWIRWAAGQSYIDSIDRSWGAIGDYVASAGQGEPDVFGNNFWREKKIPRWLRYGAATYVERFMKDPTAGEGQDSDRLRQFALTEIQKNGGMHALKEIFAFQISLNDLDNSSRLYQDAGLVVAYLLDTAKTDEKLAECHADFKSALRSGDREKVERAVIELQQELEKHGSKMKTYARPKNAVSTSAEGKEPKSVDGEEPRSVEGKKATSGKEGR